MSFLPRKAMGIFFMLTSFVISNYSYTQKLAVETKSVDNILSTTAEAVGESKAPVAKPVTERGFVLAKTTKPTTSDTKITCSLTADEFKGSISSLTENTRYYLRAYAINADGTEYGNEISFLTKTKTVENITTSTNELANIRRNIDAFIANQKESIFKVGMSVAFRTSFNWGEEKKARAIPTISPHDSTIRIDYADRAAVVISTTIAAYPFLRKIDEYGNKTETKSKFLKNLGFLVNINLVEFADNKSSSIFNKQVDGGLGFSYLLGTKKQFAFAVTYERVSVRQPTQLIFDFEGKKLKENGNYLTVLDLKDPRYFRDAGYNAFSLKFVFHFN